MTRGHDWWSGVLGAKPAEANDGNYLVFPNYNDPRVVVDRSCNVAVNEALARALKNRRVPSTAADSLAQVARPLLAKRQASWQLDDQAAGSLRSHICAALGSDVQLSVAVGPPRPNRKPVIRCYREGRLVAVAKVGPDSHTAEMVENEASWLQRLSNSRLNGFSVPELIHLETYGSAPMLIMSALPLDGDPSTHFDSMPHELLDGVFNSFPSYSFRDSPWRHRLHGRLQRLAHAELADQAELLIAQADEAELQTAAWHGDWSPWNVGQTSTGQWCIWDWERAEDGAPRGFDLCHLYETYASDASHSASSVQQRLIAAGISAEHVDLTLSLYSLERSIRLEESKHAVGPVS